VRLGPHVAIVALIAAGVPAMAQELEPEQAVLLEQARESAMRYSDSLPDFLCTEVVRRSEDALGNGRWRTTDTLTVKLSYSDHREDYKLMQINGKPTSVDYLQAGGALSTGEFGTRLASIFDLTSHGDFRWKGWTTLRKRRAARFTYRIAREDSIFRIQYGPETEGKNAIIVAYHGEVFVTRRRTWCCGTRNTRRFRRVFRSAPTFPRWITISLPWAGSRTCCPRRRWSRRTVGDMRRRTARCFASTANSRRRPRSRSRRRRRSERAPAYGLPPVMRRAPRLRVR
jgi:hypothetical protein